MPHDIFEIESKTPFSQSHIWQLNREFYHDHGITAWSDDIVPHQLTSNSKVGKTYAQLLFAFLSDLALQNKTHDTVYILELGAGHGRLSFHILKHLEQLVESTHTKLPKYCYIISDIVEKNLSFFLNHPQFEKYFQNGVLDVAYFDAIEGKELNLRYAEKTIHPQDLKQPIIAIANYFFDSIPNDLLYIEDKVISSCSVSLTSSLDPKLSESEILLANLDMTYHKEILVQPHYKDSILNEMLEEYRDSISKAYLFFPEKSIKCIANLKEFSRSGLLLLTMDKGFHETHKLQEQKEPELITHGSLSFWVNYHALEIYCRKQGGSSLFPAFSNFHLEIGCLFFLSKEDSYDQTNAAYQQFVNNFGPDDFNSIKKMVYYNVSRLKIQEVIAIIRLSAYDSLLFVQLLPRLKQLSQTLTHSEHIRLVQTMLSVWEMYFHINEPYDLSYEIAGIFYDLGHYNKALNHFQFAEELYGPKADIYYNRALCYYQLNLDEQFYKTYEEGKSNFPEYAPFDKLEKLDMS